MASPDELPDDSACDRRVSSAANAELESILSVTSHDLRGQLMTIQGFAQELELSRQELLMLLSPSALAPQSASPAQTERVRAVLSRDVSEAIGYLKGAATQIESIVNDLQRVASIVRMPFRPALVDMNRVIADSIAALHAQLPQANIRCEVATLPNCRGDAAQLTQLFVFLLDHAARYAYPGRPSKVRVTAAESEQFCIYCVADDGPGVSKSNVPKIFDLFRREGPGAETGQGLGLALARRIVIRHNGNISVESDEGTGTRFFVSLPGGTDD